MAKTYTCNNCGKTLSSYHSLWRHRKTCQVKPKGVDLNDIIDNVKQRDKEGKVISDSSSSKNVQQKIILPPVIEDVVVPIEAVSSVKPKSLTDLAIEMEGKSESEQTDSEASELDSEDESESDGPERMDIEKKLTFMPDNPRELMKAFRSLYSKFRDNIDTYNNLVLMLDEMKRMNCLTGEECRIMNEHLEKTLKGNPQMLGEV